MLSVPPTAPAPAGEGSSEQVQYVLKASLNNDVRRFRLSWPSAASGEEIINAICDAVQRSFDLPMAEHCLKYEDDDGDFCTLVKLTVVDYLSSRQGSTLKKVFVCRKEPTADIGASTGPSVSSEATLSEAASQMSIANEEEEVQAATRRQAEDEEAAAKKRSEEEAARKRRAEDEAKKQLEEEIAAKIVEAELAAKRNAAALKIQSLERGHRAKVRRSGAASRIQALVRGHWSRKEEQQKAEGTKGIQEIFEDTRGIQEPSCEMEEADPLTPTLQEFSMVTPPDSPRGESAEPAAASSIEDEYKDEYIAWTFVAEPAE